MDEEIILQRKRHSVLIQFFQDIDKGEQALPAVCLVGTKDAGKRFFAFKWDPCKLSAVVIQEALGTVPYGNIENREEAQNAPAPITNYALFHDGEYMTNEQMNEKKFLKLVKE